MDETERMSIVAEELLLSFDQLEGLLAAAESARVVLVPAELIAAVSRGDSLLMATARQVHPSNPGLRRWRFGR